ncbi:carboxypeptidase-like regulatory domain-containing protein [candidate division KSB1 bacterium]|nr:carboxypeptidase-like regulatory domain-containing protein [candidate division KSB1 bacterium]
MSNRRSLLIFLLFYTLSGKINFCSAQTWGKIVGVVRDAETGEALPGANVMVEKTSLGAAADAEGYFIILRVPPGRHNVRTEYIGYRRVLMTNVEVMTDLTTTVNFNLEAETINAEELVIVAERPLVRKDLTSSEARIQADRIKTMPVQDVGDILDLQAGIIRDTGGGIHIRGGRSSEVAYMVNGISITDDYDRGQGALKWKINAPLTLKVDFLSIMYDGKWYSHIYRLNPDGMRGTTGYGATVIGKLTHVLSKNTFYDAIFSYGT